MFATAKILPKEIMLSVWERPGGSKLHFHEMQQLAMSYEKQNWTKSLKLKGQTKSRNSKRPWKYFVNRFDIWYFIEDKF